MEMLLKSLQERSMSLLRCCLLTSEWRLAIRRQQREMSKEATKRQPKKRLPREPRGMLSNCKTEFGPLEDCDRIFQNLYGRHDWRLKGACARGDWHRTADLLCLGPDWIMAEVCRSGLRGRGGSGFYSGIKWNLLKQRKCQGKMLIVNCAEGEPGTCKDREILRHEPHKLIEGSLLAGMAMGCELCIVYIRNRFYSEACNLQFAIAEAYRHGLIGSDSCGAGVQFEMNVQRGYGYLSGEETALVNCLMGKMGRPRRRPPYLCEKGYFDHPCLVVNAESVAVVPTILRRGASWFAGLGRNKNFGTKLFNISGHVNYPCTVEEEMSIPIRDLIELHAGGVCGGWNNLLALWPGGLSTPMISRELANDVLMDYDCLRDASSDLGTGGVIVISKDCDPLYIMQTAIEFFMNATCQQCTTCRDGSIWLPEIFKNFSNGSSVPHMIDFLEVIRQRMYGTSICGLCDSQANLAGSLLSQFVPNVVQRIGRVAKNC